MTAGVSQAQTAKAAPRVGEAALRRVVDAAGIAAALAFLAAGAGWRLQEYGDGSIFSYAVAVGAAWDFHWHNIAARSFVWLATLLPGEVAVALTGRAEAGIALYGILFFAAPLAGLLLTRRLDRTPGRLVFSAACLSTAGVAPVVFGFPTEMWLAHAAFWPALAAAHCTPKGWRGASAVLALLAALCFSHEGGLVFALVILATLALRGPGDAALRRAGAAFAVVLAAWAAVKWAWPPDAYYAPILFRAAFYFIDLRGLGAPVFVLLAAALAAYALGVAALRRAGAAAPAASAAAAVALALAVYWAAFDRALHAESRYAARTALLLATPALGALAAVLALHAEGRLAARARPLGALAEALVRRIDARAAIGAIALVALVHAVESAKFVAAWNAYRPALAALAMGADSDPGLGDPAFVSAARLGAAHARMAWNSTTPYLAVLVAPGHAPARLVVDPTANYFWLTCAQARAAEAHGEAIPADSRRLIRVYACAHR